MKGNKILSSGKLLTLMKIGFTQTMIAFVICGVSMAHNNHAQVLDKEITIQVFDLPLKEVLNELSVQSGVKFAYGDDGIDLAERVSIKAEKRPLRHVLNELLAPLNIRYKVHEREATVALKKQASKAVEQSSSQAPARVNAIPHRLIPISGRVTAVTGDPMPGVNIIVKGTTNGTTSDADGRYTINAEMNDVLSFSFIGFKTVEVVFSGQSALDVVLIEDVTSLREVTINAGYYQTTKELQTGSIVKVEAEDIGKQPVSNPLAALQGRVPGLEVIQQNGVPGGNFKVRIRGTNSLSSGNNPLYIVDGVPYTSSPMSFSETSGSILAGSADAYGSSPLNNINPADIESIEVLKDADATSIYGSRAANGVILITTKRGSEGKTSFDVNYYSGFAKVIKQIKTFETAPYLAMREEAFVNDGITPATHNAPDLMLWDRHRYTDWQETLIGGTAKTHDARVAFSGGDTFTRFSIAAGFHRESTVYPGRNHDQRLSLLANISNRSRNDKLSTSFTLNTTRGATNILSRDLTAAALTLPPNAPDLYRADGKLNWDNWTSSLENPLAYLLRTYEANTSNTITNATVAYRIIEQLEAKFNFGFTSISSDATTIYPKSSYHPGQTGLLNKSVFGQNRFENWIAEPQINWNSEQSKSTISILAGATLLGENRKGLIQNAEGFSSEALMKNIAAAPRTYAGTSFYTNYRYLAFFGRINYNLSNKYILNITGRRDGSSRFGPGKQFAAFGGLGAAWIFSKETFVQSTLRFLSFGKLKASYGTTGNDQIGDYQYLNSYSPSGIYQDGTGLSPSRLFNSDFAWEVNRKFEIGLDLGLINDRLNLSSNYYRNRSSNQLVGYPLAPTTGFTTIQANFPATVQNSGIEIILTSRNIESQQGFQWTTSLNFTLPRNRLVNFPNIETAPVYSDRYEVGEPLEIVKLYHYRNVDPETGVHTVVDLNGDGFYDINDRKSIRFIGRAYYGGVQNRFSFAGFNLDLLVQFVRQSGYNTSHLFSRAPGTLSNQPERVTGKWTEPGQAGKEIQRLTSQSWTTAGQAYESYYYNSTAAISDASFLRLKNLSLSYSVPRLHSQRIHLQELTVFLQGQNLITITKYEGLDPENPGSAALPPLRTFSAGIRVKI